MKKELTDLFKNSEIAEAQNFNRIAPKRVKKNKDYLEMLYQYERMGFIKRLNFDATFIDHVANPILSGKCRKILNLRRMLKIQILHKLNKLCPT